jgi:hypothetical protein
MPAAEMIFWHPGQAGLVMYSVAPTRSSLLQWITAFSSAWRATHLPGPASYPVTPGVACEVRRGQVSQPGAPEGDPLYPVPRMRRSLTTTAPTLLLSQSDRVATVRAMLRKYSSKVGRTGALHVLVCGNYPVVPDPPSLQPSVGEVRPVDRTYWRSSGEVD